jgi:hypothetical protein
VSPRLRSAGCLLAAVARTAADLLACEHVAHPCVTRGLHEHAGGGAEDTGPAPAAPGRLP